MDKYIGIITAMDEEAIPIKQKLENITEEQIYDLKIYKGKIKNTNYLLVKSGIGKVNAARATQVLIDNYKIEYIINIGVCGSLSENLHIGDFVLGKTLIQHDFDISIFGHEKGYISGIGKEFYSSQELIDKLIKKENELNIVNGVIVTGDSFCTEISLKEEIKRIFNADAVEMEAAAIAQVCKLCKVPFLAIKVISDEVNGKNVEDYNEFLKVVVEKLANLIINVLTDNIQ